MLLNLSEVKDGLVRICVAYTGDYDFGGQNFSITEADLRQIAANLNKREVVLDYEHASAVPGQPPGYTKAAGWLRGPATIERFNHGAEALWAWAELTPACLAAVRNKEYRYFSPEIHWKDKDENGNATGTRLAAGAITNRPFLKMLPPIEISAAEYPQLLEAAALCESRRMMDLQSVHVPGVVNGERAKSMKTFKLKKLTSGEHAGKAAVFEGDEMLGLCDMSDFGQVAGDSVAASERGPSQRELDRAVTAYMSEHKDGNGKPVDKITAIREVTRRNPNLWERAKAEGSWVFTGSMFRTAGHRLSEETQASTFSGREATSRQDASLEFNRLVTTYMTEQRESGKPVDKITAFKAVARRSPELWAALR